MGKDRVQVFVTLVTNAWGLPVGVQFTAPQIDALHAGGTRYAGWLEALSALPTHDRRVVEHYHLERNHQGLDNRLIVGAPATGSAGRVRRRSRLGGLLNDYERAA